MAPTFCYRCGDAVEEGYDQPEEVYDPRDELAKLDALLKRLRLRRYDLKRKINQFHSPIVRQLPPDITWTIFEFCLPDFSEHPLTSYYVKDAFSKPLHPLSLGAICSYWRDIAWSTPSLWSSMVVHDPSKNFVTGIAQEWLTRSGQLPLSIRISSTSNNLTVLALVDIINQYSSRWSNLDLNIPDGYYRHLHAIDNHAAICAPILKSIGLHCSSHNPSRPNLNFQLTSCPRLERASLSHFPIDGSNIQWDNLTHLTLTSMSFTDTFGILRKTPRLVFCQIEGFFFSEETGPPVLTSMKSLHLNSYNVDYLLDNLIAPHLEEFSLPIFHHLSTVAVISSFFRRSACSLRSLSMNFSIALYFEEFVDILQSMPLLTTLSLSVMNPWTRITTPEEYHPRSILQLLAKVLFSQSTSLQQGFLPNLKILKYTGKLYPHPGNYDDIYPLPPVVDNAVHGPLHLFELDLHPAKRISGSMISYISSLAERGVTVNVVSGSEDILQTSIDYNRWREDFDWSDNLDSSPFS